MMRTSELEYPVLEMEYLWVSPDEDTLTTTSARVMDWRNGTIIVDSAGRTARIRDATFLCGKGWFWGYSLLLRRIVRVELMLDEEPQSMPLEEVRDEVIGKIEVEAEMGWQKEVRRLREAPNMRDLIERLLPKHDRRKLIRILRTL